MVLIGEMEGTRFFDNHPKKVIFITEDRRYNGAEQFRLSFSEHRQPYLFARCDLCCVLRLPRKDANPIWIDKHQVILPVGCGVMTWLIQNPIACCIFAHERRPCNRQAWRSQQRWLDIMWLGHAMLTAGPCHTWCHHGGNFVEDQNCKECWDELATAHIFWLPRNLDGLILTVRRTRLVCLQSLSVEPLAWLLDPSCGARFPWLLMRSAGGVWRWQMLSTDGAGRCPGLIKMVPQGTEDWLFGGKVCRLIWSVLRGKCWGQPLETRI